ncbi:MAG: carbon storage regulator CsrA [Spirochaetota bacterium]
MLILSRKSNQSIVIGNDIELVVIEVRGDQVKLGIKAPKHISVFRKEIYEEIQAENQKASDTAVLPEQLQNFKNTFLKNKPQ